MAHGSAANYPDSDTLTNWKAWAQFISDAFTACGWTQTTDTGQVDWSTVTLPSSGVGNAVYEVWKTADALSTAYPIYVKVEYYLGGSNEPSLRLTVGTGGTDGAGNLSTPKSSTQTVVTYNGSVQNSRQLDCYYSGDAGGIRILLFNGGTAGSDFYANTHFSVSRSRDASGAPTGDYVFMCSFAGSSRNVIHQCVNNAGLGGVHPQETTTPLIAVPQTAASGSSGGSTLVSPFFPFVGALGNPTTDQFVGIAADFSDNGTTTIDVYGVTHTYIVMDNASGTGPGWGQSNKVCAFLMRYE